MRARQRVREGGNLCRRAAIALILLSLAGCSRAPSFNVLGSYFPGWIACLILGVLTTSLAHLILSRMSLERHLPWLPLFYLSMTTLVACSLWLIAFE